MKLVVAQQPSNPDSFKLENPVDVKQAFRILGKTNRIWLTTKLTQNKEHSQSGISSQSIHSVKMTKPWRVKAVKHMSIHEYNWKFNT